MVGDILNNNTLFGMIIIIFFIISTAIGHAQIDKQDPFTLQNGNNCLIAAIKTYEESKDDFVFTDQELIQYTYITFRVTGILQSGDHYTAIITSGEEPAAPSFIIKKGDKL